LIDLFGELHHINRKLNVQITLELAVAIARNEWLLTPLPPVEKYIAAHEGSWRNAKHRAQWKSTLETYAYPTIGDLAVSAVDTTLVIGIVEPLWSAKPETAGRVRGRIESVLDWARVREYRQGENPARWKGTLTICCPSDRRSHG
jgi:hypothetical protein